ncbi:hypothetical protein FPRO05_13704 [Fusarium proliferatum]|uniref:Uncharacterized protein n=1 Tax=Gibberella intermedia TaxID=948311 RepID=A0A365MXJ7_GIBIN|nr:hypothetical protein FPRO05_13704 [Fusarium proliferatum]
MSGPEKQQPCLHLENNTEATKANTESPEAFGLADEKRLVRKLDRTILPWIMLLYLLSYINRSNMGNARNIGLEDGLAKLITGTSLGLALGLETTVLLLPWLFDASGFFMNAVVLSKIIILGMGHCTFCVSNLAVSS